jgi:hypothetical protein
MFQSRIDETDVQENGSSSNCDDKGRVKPKYMTKYMTKKQNINGRNERHPGRLNMWVLARQKGVSEKMQAKKGLYLTIDTIVDVRYMR